MIQNERDMLVFALRWAPYGGETSTFFPNSACFLRFSTGASSRPWHRGITASSISRLDAACSSTAPSSWLVATRPPPDRPR